jgi:ethanolamine kinase
MQKWIYALPAGSDAERLRQAALQRELIRLVAELSGRPGLGDNSVCDPYDPDEEPFPFRLLIENLTPSIKLFPVDLRKANFALFISSSFRKYADTIKLVFAHCDLLSGNVIVQPRPKDAATTKPVETVSFIDYEYAAPSPAAFDLANHFAEWGGFDCDFSVLPTRSQRLDFLREYIRSYFFHRNHQNSQDEEEAEVRRLFDEVDIFRGVPGFYWGIWALIQATISQIDFDYAAYAEIRLGEYWAWREEMDGSREASEKEMPLRERRWAQEA